MFEPRLRKISNFQEFVHRLDIANRTMTKIALLGHERSASGTRGHWVGISPSGNPMLLRDKSNNNIYALEWNRD